MRWPRAVLRFPETEGGGGGGDKTPESEVPKTFKIGNKEIAISELESAHSLYSALQDKDTATEIIGTLARRAGLIKDIKEADTPKEKKIIEGKITKLIKSKLGKDGTQFADTIGSLLDEAVQEYLEEHSTKIGEASHATGWEGEIETFVETHELTDEIDTEMRRLITRNGGVPRGLKGKAAQEFLDDMFELAVHKLGDGEEKPRKGVQSTRNRRSEVDDLPEFREVARPKTVSVDDAVEAAMRGIKFK